MKKISTESFQLSTGKIIHPNEGIIGIADYDGKYRIFGGYDDEFWTRLDTKDEKYVDLTDDEAKEIAVYMITLWTKFISTLNNDNG